MENNIKSHVYLAESILNRFCFRDKNDKKIINYIDLKKMQIDSCTTKKFNRIMGYYTNKNEQILKSKSEEKIGNVIAKLEKNRIEDNVKVILNEDEKNIIKKYLAYQWIRNDSIIETIIYKLNLKIDKKTLKNLIIEDEEKYRLFIDRTLDLDIIVFFNNTNKQYIINGATSTINSNSEDYYIINMVLTPNILISFCKKGSIKKYLNLSTDFIVKPVPNVDAVLDCNIHTMNVAYKEEPHFVVGRKEELETTLELYKEILKYKEKIN